MQWMTAPLAAIALAVAALVTSLTPAQAQTPSAPAPAAISDQKIDAAAAATKLVAALSDNYQQKLTLAPNADKPRIVREADGAIRKAITDQGLSVEEYASIMRVAQIDTTVRDRLRERMK